MMRAVLALLLALIALPVLAQDSQSEDTTERITSFDSDITVARNGTLSVTETIAVYANGEQIRHGIYRDFPTRYTDKNGANVHVRFDVTRVTPRRYAISVATVDLPVPVASPMSTMIGRSSSSSSV